MNLVRLILQFVWYRPARFQGCDADTSWNNFASSTGYANSRLVVPGNLFIPRYIPKDRITSFIWARMDCSQSCAIDDVCQAFNFFENETRYVCELLSVNLCRNGTALTLTKQPGGSVWDRLTKGTKTSCFETVPNFGVPCGTVRPGCLGTTPNCYNCTRTCMDCYARYKITTNCTLWPDGDAMTSVPIAGQCTNVDETCLLRRRIDLANKKEASDNYIMSFYDMHRMIRIKAYNYLQITFKTTKSRVFFSVYAYPFMDENGTLSNLTNYPMGFTTGDMFNLGGLAMKPTPFVNVTVDLYSCGSFWLLSSANATYCPGGTLGMFGTIKTNATTVLNTGISHPLTVPGELIYWVSVTLMHF